MSELTSDKILIALCVFFIAVECYNKFATARKNRREEQRLRDSPITQLAERVDGHDEILREESERLDNLEKQLKQTGEESRIMLRGVRALLSHEINGNSNDKLEKSMAEIDNYLIDRK